MLARPPSHSPALGPGCAGPPLAEASSVSIQYPAQPTAQVPTCGAASFLVDHNAVNAPGRDPSQHTQMPYVTGSSVLALTFKDGVMLASDTLGSYGSTKRYKSFERIRKVNDRTVLGASGELSDFQYIMNLLDELTTDDFCEDDGGMLSPREIWSYLCRVLYNRRNKQDPLWNSLVIGGIEHGKPFLGTVGMIGTHYTDDHIATGFGNMLARPLFREKHSPDMSEADAEALIHEALKVCYYRDKQSINKFQLAKITEAGVSVSEPFALPTRWDYKHFENPSANAVGTW
ncbi:hypothetical protein WJX73_005874 [Symbiochloris irregularis]|uniref:Proteasome subunit beta n=1 Tax=Symbiochloris irregularis TaxID=706552 RepID=A0AAW1NTB3_9CHLO